MQCDSEELVALVLKSPAIYDHSLKQHSNRVVIKKLWKEIAQEMKCSVFECKAKWGHLRSAYSRYLREGENTPQGRRRKKWYMADQMKFLEKHINPQRRSPSPINKKSDIEQPSVSSTSAKRQRNDNADESSSDTDVDVGSISPDYETPLTPPVFTKRNKKSTTVTVAEPLVKYFRSKTEQTKTENDADSMFFKSMLADYKNLTQKRKRYFRELMVTTMNKLQEEDENDQMQPYVCSVHRDSVVEIKCEEYK